MTRKPTKWLLKRLSNAFYVLLRFFNYYPYYQFLHNRYPRTELAPDYIIEFSKSEKEFLKTCSASYNYLVPDFSMGHRQSPLQLFEIKDVKYLSRTGAIIKNGKPIVESGMSIDRLTGTKTYRDFSILIPKTYKEGVYTTIQHGHLADHNISHWFLECLPRLYILTQLVNEQVTILMRKDAPLYQIYTLESLIRAYPNIKIKYVSKYLNISIASFRLPSFVNNSYSGYLPGEISSWLRKNLWDSYKITYNSFKSRVYVSRGKAKTRRIINEVELITLLKKHGFKTIYAEELDYGQQIQLFYDAEAVVSPHGAGLTNILFSESCKILELHPAHIIKPHYMLLAKGLGFDYTPIIGSNGDQHEDFVVPVEAVEKWLQSKFVNS
ncbi:glycosyltransferase family 61 protein [Pontibacter litorisediminis]|uniref:glycosyltransferase family 61 protein n=1 Tax=Pontibacter litorisediminis TaxID=1846260 RepID=UPI0023EBCBC1|nr:glycosyltransferase family 61 protein [Pontibacter litorisediminis]